MTKKQAIKVLTHYSERYGATTEFDNAVETAIRLLSKPAKHKPITVNSAIVPKCRKCKKRKCQNYGKIGGFSVQCKTCNLAQSAKRRAK